MRLFNTKKKKLVAASIAAVGVIGAGAIAANAAGGTGCATLTYPLCARSVSSVQIVDNSVAEVDLAPAVKDKLNKVGTGEAGPAGPEGPAGAAGATGKDGVSGLSVDGPQKTVPKGYSTVTLTCADGKKAIGGGLKWDTGSTTAADVFLNGSYPSDITEANGVSTAASWTVALTNNDPKGAITVQPFVTCVTAS
ncbi:hypothetical protein ACFV9C_23405 [Kribbella sp. NPDC059898]|uniref:hypothetical protein n=1 Tax=Kribbella sp. NPDC059898 TaxID=3346995 RepID=UPI0036496511